MPELEINYLLFTVYCLTPNYGFKDKNPNQKVTNTDHPF